MGTVKGICISKKRGTQKHEVEEAKFVADWGIREDAHAGRWHRQVSILSAEKIEAFREQGAEVDYGAFGENLIVDGYDFKTFPVGTRFRCGTVLLEITQIGKECHSHCEIYQKMGDCIMPREGVFAKVLVGGVIRRGDVFEKEYSDLYSLLEEKRGSKECLLATVVAGNHIGERICMVEGKMWSVAGASALGAAKRFEEKNQAYGEEFLAKRIRWLLQTEKNGVIDVDGERVFCEWIAGEQLLVICGAGHVSIPIIELGKRLGFRVVVLEDRPKFADEARRAGADEVLCENFEQGMQRIAGSPGTYFVIVTRGHRYDTECLRAALKKPHAYIGMMGSSRRVGIVKEQLRDEGMPEELLEHIFAPIGLPIGAETPEEIAVAIIAEIIEVKNRRKKGGEYEKELLACLAGRSDEKKVLSTIVSHKGSAPRKAGTKMLVLEDGRTLGTIGGGCMESEVIRESLRMLRPGGPFYQLIQVDMTGRQAEDEGMVCGGTIEVYMEQISEVRVLMNENYCDR